MRRIFALLSRFKIVLTALMFCGLASAEDWPQFGRDQTRNAVSPEKNPSTWWQFVYADEYNNKVDLNASKNIRWAAPLGFKTGHWSNACGDPVVVDGMVWVGTMGLFPKGKDGEEVFSDERRR